MKKKYKKSDLNILKDNYEFFKNILLYPNEKYVKAKVINESVEEVEIEYELPQHFQKLSSIKNALYQERLILFLNSIDLIRNNHEYLESDINADNIIYTPEFNVFLIERKLRVSNQLSEEEILIKAKKNLVYLFSKYNYERVMNMDNKIWKKNKIIADFMDIDNMEEFIKAIEEKIIELVDDLDKNQKIVARKKYKKLVNFKRINRILELVLIIIVLYLGAYKLPLYKNQVDIVSDYEKGSYSEVLNTSKNINPKRLSSTIKYYVAVSSIKSEPLTDIQKENLLINLTPNVDSWELEYWIYIGQGNYDMAYNRAIDLKSLDLQEYAVLKKLDMLDIDTQISGEEKQEKRKDYESEIESIDKQRKELEEED